MWEYNEWPEYVVCVDNTRGNSRKLAMNKIYKTRKMTTDEKIKYRLPTDYIILELDAREVWCDRKCFIPLDEFRNRKLNQIL